jgi:hypothetical protein
VVGVVRLLFREMYGENGMLRVISILYGRFALRGATDQKCRCEKRGYIEKYTFIWVTLSEVNFFYERVMHS